MAGAGRIICVRGDGEAPMGVTWTMFGSADDQAG